MRGYKFLDSSHVESTLRGRVRFSTLEYYRNLDGPQWIADSSEGVQITRIDDFIFKKDHNEAEFHREKLKKLGINMGQGADGPRFIGCTSTVAAELCYAFCFSLDPFESARKAMCVDAPKEYRYNSCVEIADVEIFVGALVRSGSIEGTCAHDLFNELAVGEVSYGKRDLDFDIDTEFGVDPFLKHKIFEYQQEYRILWFPKEYLGENFLVDFVVPPGLLQMKTV